jgi:hypothetical protein
MIYKTLDTSIEALNGTTVLNTGIDQGAKI